MTNFGNCAELIRDSIDPSNSKDLPYIGLEHISQGTLSLLSFGKSSEVISQKTLFKKGDILFGKLRPYFRKVIIAPFDGVCSTDIWVVRAKSDVDQRYLYYWMASEEFIEIATRASEGTKMPRAKWDYLCKVEKKLPSLPVQQKIASILGALDDKIELNRRMNRALESIAQTVFEEMFISNPESKKWNSDNVLQIADLFGGGTPSTKERSYWNGDILWVSAKDVSNVDGVFLLETEKKITQKGIENSTTKKLPKNTTIITARGTVGKLCLLGKEMAINQTNYGLKAKNNNEDYFVYFSGKSIIKNLRQQSYGSIFDTITTRTFQAVSYQIPPHELIAKFEKIVQPFMDQIFMNQQESRSLASIRDFLLVKLLN